MGILLLGVFLFFLYNYICLKIGFNIDRTSLVSCILTGASRFYFTLILIGLIKYAITNDFESSFNHINIQNVLFFILIFCLYYYIVCSMVALDAFNFKEYLIDKKELINNNKNTNLYKQEGNQKISEFISHLSKCLKSHPITALLAVILDYKPLNMLYKGLSEFRSCYIQDSISVSVIKNIPFFKLPFHVMHPLHKIAEIPQYHKLEGNYIIKNLDKLKNLDLVQNLKELLSKTPINLYCDINFKFSDDSVLGVKLNVIEGKLDKIELNSITNSMSKSIYSDKVNLYKSNTDLDVLMNPNSHFNHSYRVYMNNFNASNFTPEVYESIHDNSNASRFIPEVCESTISSVNLSLKTVNLNNVNSQETFLVEMNKIIINLENCTQKGRFAAQTYVDAVADYSRIYRVYGHYEEVLELSKTTNELFPKLNVIQSKFIDSVSNRRIWGYIHVFINAKDLILQTQVFFDRINRIGVSNPPLVYKNSLNVLYTTLCGTYRDIIKINRVMEYNFNQLTDLIENNMGKRKILLGRIDFLSELKRHPSYIDLYNLSTRIYNFDEPATIGNRELSDILYNLRNECINRNISRKVTLRNIVEVIVKHKSSSGLKLISKFGIRDPNMYDISQEYNKMVTNSHYLRIKNLYAYYNNIHNPNAVRDVNDPKQIFITKKFTDWLDTQR